MAKANYKAEVIEVRGNTCLVIEDLNQGGKSVTNDIENVVNEVIDKHWNENEKLIDKNRCTIVYKDSQGNWDGWDAENNHFVALGKDNHMHAINSYLKKIRATSEAQ